ncbi:MAG: aminotransferase class V-fold PLP-dependent enzyme, partial [Absicoccus porci]|uniref:aminotransferase class V-fold PLP-dependent enzyme n=1 Tax=Absicoccus porci TaxID=2486576 RepID=UPI00240A5CBF
TLIHSLINGGKQEFGFRAGTENVASIVGMAKALENNVRLLTSNQKKLQCLEKEFYEVLDSAKVDYRRNGATNHLPGMINISIKGVSGELLLHRMDLAGCYISTGSACDGESDQISHVIKAIKVPPEYAYGTIRISFGKYNEIGDGEETAKRLLHILETKL